MRKILFLDFDGVLRTKIFDLGLDYSLVENLNFIVESTNCEIVISSNWREDNDLERLKDILQFNGFNHREKIIDVTPMLHYSDVIVREEEIQLWMKDHGVKSEEIVIVDDWEYFFKELTSRTVITDPDVGLNKSIAEKIIGVLK